MAKAKKAVYKSSKKPSLNDLLYLEIPVYGAESEIFVEAEDGRIFNRKVRMAKIASGEKYVCLNDVIANLGLKNITSEVGRSRTQVGTAESFIRVKLQKENREVSSYTSTYIPVRILGLYLAALDTYRGSDDLNRKLLKEFQKEAASRLSRHFTSSKRESKAPSAVEEKLDVLIQGLTDLVAQLKSVA